MLSYNIYHIIVNREVFEFLRKIEKQLFNIYFLNRDISLNNELRNTKF